MSRSPILLIALSLLASCAAAPPLPLSADSPASLSAPDAMEHPPRNALVADDLTRKTRQIFAEADKQKPSPAPTPQQQQMDQMPGMKMP
jgi:hypothetical protein